MLSKFLSLFLLVMTALSANQNVAPLEVYPFKGKETIPLAKTVFQVQEGNHYKIVNLVGQNFIVVSVREAGSDGRFYAVDVDGTVWWSGAITSGTLEFKTPSGIFPIIHKKRYHMSTLYPEESGVNNMNYMMKFTQGGHALHQGSINWLSHGCIHVDPKDIPTLYNWATYKTKVIITRHSYMPFATKDLQRIYYSK